MIFFFKSWRSWWWFPVFAWCVHL